MNKIEVLVTYKYELIVDDNNEIVKEYKSLNELITDCATYRFDSILPVIEKNGVVVKDAELVETKILE